MKLKKILPLLLPISISIIGCTSILYSLNSCKKSIFGFGQIKLSNGKKITVNNVEELNKLCNSDSADSEIQLNNITFKNNDVISFEFGKDFQGDIPDNFLKYFININSALQIPHSVKKIGSGFLENCVSFNNGGKAFTIPNSVTMIGESFLDCCICFDQELKLSNSITTINKDFMWYCRSFNNGGKTFSIPEGVTKISDSFLDADPAEVPEFIDTTSTPASKFNQEINLPISLTTISKFFLYNNINFNKPISIPTNVNEIDDGFMQSCTNFNSNIYLTKVTGIKSNFLADCTSFNTSFVISDSVEFIGNNFLENCINFNQDFSLSTNLKGAPCIGDAFFSNCYKMTKIINTKTVEASAFSSNSFSFSADNLTCDAITKGISIKGNNAGDILSAFPNNIDEDSGTPFRNLKLVLP